MTPRDYQIDAVESVERAFTEVDRVMGVAATGSGKTIMASLQMQREKGNCLFLADAQELVNQNADKYHQLTGEHAGVEMGAQTATIGEHRVVVATAQSLSRRLNRYDSDYFNLIIADECHRNSLGDMSQKVLNHFKYAKILGVTATPWRSDKKELGNYYQKIAFDIGLPRLIREGYLSRIVIKSIPMPVDLSRVGTQAGDYKVGDLGEVIEPILKEAAKQLVAHASDRKKIVIFLPLIKTSMRMTRILNEMGIKAVHCSGEDKSQIREFTHGDARVICNAQLLTTGWDCPEVDCVLVLRPTKSLALYSQMVGRGTRIAEGKRNLLVLDPLFLTDDHRLVNPARLVARDEEEAKAMMEKLGEDNCGDLLLMEEDIEEQRAEALRTRMKQKEKRKARTVDAMEFALNADSLETAEFESGFGWELEKPSARQIEILEKSGFETDEIETRGKASKVIDLLFLRRKKGLATPKQLRVLKKHGHPSPALVTFEDAGTWIVRKFAQFKRSAQPSSRGELPTSVLIRLRRAGLNPVDFKTRTEAELAMRNVELSK